MLVLMRCQLVSVPQIQSETDEQRQRAWVNHIRIEYAAGKPYAICIYICVFVYVDTHSYMSSDKIICVSRFPNIFDTRNMHIYHITYLYLYVNLHNIYRYICMYISTYMLIHVYIMSTFKQNLSISSNERARSSLSVSS